MKIEVRNRGRHMVELSEKNRARVFEYFSNNPGQLMKIAEIDLGMSPPALRRHVRAINDGWRPAGHGRD